MHDGRAHVDKYTLTHVARGSRRHENAHTNSYIYLTNMGGGGVRQAHENETNTHGDQVK